MVKSHGLEVGNYKSRVMSVPAAKRAEYMFGLRRMALDFFVDDAEAAVVSLPAAGADSVVLLGVSCPFRPGDPVLEASELDVPVTEVRVDWTEVEPDEVPAEIPLELVPVLVEVDIPVMEGVLDAFEDVIVDEDNPPVAEDDAAVEEALAASFGANPGFLLILISLKQNTDNPYPILSGHSQRQYTRF